MTSKTLEVWFYPTGGADLQPTLLDARPFNPASDPPATYRVGDVDLLAANTRIVTRSGQVVHQVFMVDADYVNPDSVNPIEHQAEEHR